MLTTPPRWRLSSGDKQQRIFRQILPVKRHPAGSLAVHASSGAGCRKLNGFFQMFKKVLIANRGEIALRIQRSLRSRGVKSVAVYSEADVDSLHRIEADEAYCIGSGPASESYLNVEKILEVAQESGAEAVHPGYGFLSENAEFARACEANGIVFIGPTPENMEAFGLKHSARELAERSGVPLLPGTGLLAGKEEAIHEAEGIGYPVMLKSTAGGGGIGMSVCWDREELYEAYDRIDRLSRNNFGNQGIYLEKYVQVGRHIEVQVFGDGLGNAIALGERDCSTQRRHQKVIEETPAPGISEITRSDLLRVSVNLAKEGKYRSAGTMEYIYDEEDASFYFLEVNTRLQVEHGVTEEVTGIDLVDWMLLLAAGDMPPLDLMSITPSGCAMQVRVYAEDPARDFRPSSGLITALDLPENVRVDSWITAGCTVPPYYDPLLSKLIVKADTREEVLDGMKAALDATRIYGIETNVTYLRGIFDQTDFATGKVHVKLLDHYEYTPNAAEVLKPGMQTHVQDVPGRTGYWVVGVPPSGPMDNLHFRLANRLLGNPEDAAALEMTLVGPSLKFYTDTWVCISGADMKPEIDGHPCVMNQLTHVAAGEVLSFGQAREAGQRAYLAVAGGWDVPETLGSRSTFMLGKFGGHGGRALMTGDMLHFSPPPESMEPFEVTDVPELGSHWEIGVLYGPHGAPDFFTPKDINTLFETDWEVHFNSDRTGVRLTGPRPEWAREDGGEAGLHPSNIHDNAYAVGAIDFTGDMPILLGPDGPSLGGFVCPATIVNAELWKMGQLKPGDTIRFKRLSPEEAADLDRRREKWLQDLGEFPKLVCSGEGENSPEILYDNQAADEEERMVIRRSGDRNLLIEFGPLKLELNLRFRAHVLMEAIESQNLPGILDLTPGIRSLQVHFDPGEIPLPMLLVRIIRTQENLPDLDEIKVPSRVVHLPLSWDDPATHEAIEKYTSTVRPDAPWCPSNIEFIRRINGLKDIEAVKKVVFNAHYLVLGLGDVYLGAPVATPVDPRHRLVTTKYNPARTWTAENSVGIGGAYLCVYGMEGPGGYQFVGRTLQMWNRYELKQPFESGKPWLLRFFDQIRFYPVSHEELLRIREDFPHGLVPLKIEETELDLQEFHRFLEENQSGIQEFKQQQQKSFEDERARWAEAGQAEYIEEDLSRVESDGPEIPEGSEAVTAPVPGSVWKVQVQAGLTVQEGDTLLIMESMKMEVPVLAEKSGSVSALFCKPGDPVKADQILAAISTDSL